MPPIPSVIEFIFANHIVCPSHAHPYAIIFAGESSIIIHIQAVSPVKCDVIKRKDDPNRVNETPTAPLVLIRVPGLVAKLAVQIAGANIHVHTYNTNMEVKVRGFRC